MGFWPGAEPQVWSFAVRFDVDNRATTTEVRRIGFREVFLYEYPGAFVTEKSELIDILIFLKWPNRGRNGFVEHTAASLAFLASRERSRRADPSNGAWRCAVLRQGKRIRILVSLRPPEAEACNIPIRTWSHGASPASRRYRRIAGSRLAKHSARRWRSLQGEGRTAWIGHPGFILAWGCY
jgi:hypothetical protein